MKREPQTGSVHLQIERRRLHGPLLVSGQTGEVIIEVVGNDEDTRPLGFSLRIAS